MGWYLTALRGGRVYSSSSSYNSSSPCSSYTASSCRAGCCLPLGSASGGSLVLPRKFLARASRSAACRLASASAMISRLGKFCFARCPLVWCGKPTCSLICRYAPLLYGSEDIRMLPFLFMEGATYRDRALIGGVLWYAPRAKYLGSAIETNRTAR